MLNPQIQTSYTIQSEDELKKYSRGFDVISRKNKISPRKAGPTPNWVNTYPVKTNYPFNSEAINIIAEQIALDIDTQIINDLFGFYNNSK